MKPAKNTENLKSFVRRALKESKKAEVQQITPLRAIVRAILSAEVGDAKADDALKVIDREFVDLNELRVATELEIQDMLGVRYPGIEHRAVQIVAILNGIFDREGTLSLDRIRTLGKKESRQFLRELPEMTAYIDAYIMLHAFDTPAVPVDEALMKALRDADAVEATTSADDAQSALEGLLKVDEMVDFHVGARKLLARR
jgi:endonuclease III